MPAKPKNDTLARLLELLQAIPHRRFASPEELTQALNSRGYQVHVRTVQRDLKLLSEHLPLEVRDASKPHGWGWKESPPDGIAGIGTSVALMVALVERHLKAALPAAMLETFAPTFDRARRRLAKLGAAAGTTKWPDKVAVAPVALVGQTPAAPRLVLEAVSTALLQERQLDCLYKAGTAGAPRRYRLHPLGIVLRGGTTYLVATKGLGKAHAFFALQRFESAEVCLESVQHEFGLSLRSAISSTKGQFGVPAGGQTNLHLHLACDKVSAGYLEESPLGKDQQLVKRDDGRIAVTVTVANSWELRWWLLSRCESVEVIAPAVLRQQIATTLRQGLALYGDR